MKENVCFEGGVRAIPVSRIPRCWDWYPVSKEKAKLLHARNTKNESLASRNLSSISSVVAKSTRLGRLLYCSMPDVSSVVTESEIWIRIRGKLIKRMVRP
jgi:hypothetical protein